MEENKNQNTVNPSSSEKAMPNAVQLPNSPIAFIPYFIPYGGQNMPQGINSMPAQFFGTATQPATQPMVQTSPMLELAPSQSSPLKIPFIFGIIIAILAASGYMGYQFLNRDTTVITTDDSQKEASPLKGQLTIGAGTKEAEVKELPELGQTSTLTSSEDIIQLSENNDESANANEEAPSGVAR